MGACDHPATNQPRSHPRFGSTLCYTAFCRFRSGWPAPQTVRIITSTTKYPIGNQNSPPVKYPSTPIEPGCSFKNCTEKTYQPHRHKVGAKAANSHRVHDLIWKAEVTKCTTHEIPMIREANRKGHS